ncbi:hypothetical protein [Nocardia puris]|uniref:hypothetical protein n=1 Tax=Nocardia puris TaxID=208602 RepID=UPI002E24ED08
MSGWTCAQAPDRRLPAPRAWRGLGRHELLVLDLAGVGGEPDHWLALWWAARQLDSAGLVVSGMERGWQARARLARRITRSLGRIGVVHVAGAQARAGAGAWIAAGLPDSHEDAPVSMHLRSALTQVLPSYAPRIRWVCCGPATNLMAALTDDAEAAGASLGLARRCSVTLLADDRYVSADPAAVEHVLANVGEVTVVDPSALAGAGLVWDEASVVGARVQDSSLPGVADFRRHLRHWQGRTGRREVVLGAPAALAAALGRGTRYRHTTVALGATGLVLGAGGHPARVATVEVAEVLGMLATALTPEPELEYAQFERVRL